MVEGRLLRRMDEMVAWWSRKERRDWYRDAFPGVHFPAFQSMHENQAQMRDGQMG